MSNKFIDGIKHVIIEDDDPKPDAQKQAQAHPQVQTDPAPAVSAPVARSSDSSAYQTMSGQPMSEETEHVYQRILAKTNFASTQVSATIHKYLDPLDRKSTL